MPFYLFNRAPGLCTVERLSPLPNVISLLSQLQDGEGGEQATCDGRVLK